MRSLKLTLLPGVALSLMGCSDRLKPGTAGILDQDGATQLTVQFLQSGSQGGKVAAGTKVRVVKDESPKDNEYREVKVLILEGDHKNENVEVARNHIEQ